VIAIAHLVAGFWTASNIIELVLAASAATAAGAAWWQAQKTQSLVKTTNNAAEAAREQVALGGKQLEVDRLMLEYSNKPLLSDLRNSYLRPLTANKEYFCGFRRFSDTRSDCFRTPIPEVFGHFVRDGT
jgi:hypothetical protein